MFKSTAANTAATGTCLRLSRLKAMLARGVSALGSRRFRCRAELLTSGRTGADEQAFRVQMQGRIGTPADDWNTDVRVEITDITDGAARAEPVLSTDRAYQSGRGAVFAFQRSNGRVSAKNAVLARWVTAAEIPCDVLRFACRGRRRLLFCVSILCSETGQVLSSASCRRDYVSCRDGYRQQQQRRLEVLQSAVTIAAAACSQHGQIPSRAVSILRQWLCEAARTFPPAEQLEAWLGDIAGDTSACSTEQAADRLLAWGYSSDKLAAIELALRCMACSDFIVEARVLQVVELAQTLEVAEERFLELAQRAFLTMGCALENPSVLAGIDASMCPTQAIRRLNDEYRKWNARVTHPSAEVRQMADKMLSLIADLRSGRFSSTA